MKYRVLKRLFPASRQILYIARQECFSSIYAAGPGADKSTRPLGYKRRKERIPFWILKLIDITINQKFYKIYQTPVSVALKKILMLTTNFYFDYD